MKKASMVKKTTAKAKAKKSGKSKSGVGGFSYAKKVSNKKDRAYNEKQMEVRKRWGQWKKQYQSLGAIMVWLTVNLCKALQM